MTGITLVVCRIINFHRFIKANLELLGFKNVSVTAAEHDGLNMLIHSLNPDLVIFDCEFYQSSTRFLLGRLLRVFPDLNVAVVAVRDYKPDLGVCFISNGVKSFIGIADGDDEFLNGLNCIRDGKHYISPYVAERIISRDEMPRGAKDLTKMQLAVFRLLSNGYTCKEISEELNISERTVEYHREEIYKNLQVRNIGELNRVGTSLGYIKDYELNFYGGNYELHPLPEKNKNNGGVYDCKNKKRRN